MKILKQNIKEQKMELLPETLDDLWHLSHIVAVGDNVSSKTTRRIQDNSGDKIRSDRGVIKTFFLGIDVESVTFQMFNGKLRLTGVITRGPEDLIPLGSHHTLEVKLNTPLIIKKQKWSKYAIDRVKQAVEASKKLSAMMIVIEDDVATFGLMRQFGIEYSGPVKGHLPGKWVIDKNRNKHLIDFYERIVTKINNYDNIQNIIIAGPGFVKNGFFNYLKDKHSDIAKKAIVEDIGTGGRVGVSELIKKGVVDKLTSENRVANEIRAVDELLTEIAKNPEKTTYGVSQTANAINMGAVEKLLVLDKSVPQDNIENLMEIVNNMNGEVFVISSEHEGGDQLSALGGIAAILRYAIS